jgi:hypothetical protein
LKPFRLATIIDDVPDEAAGITRLPGLAVNEKSGAPIGGTVNAMLTKCERAPLLPVTVTVQVLGGVPRVEANVRVE